MTEIKLYKTTTKGLKIIGMCLPFVVLGLFLLSDATFGSTNYIMSWLCICFFGLGIPIGLFQTFDKRPQIIISENGIWDRTTNQDEVKWEQIIEAYLLDIHGQKFISLVTDETFVFKKKIYKWAEKINREIGAQNLNLHLGQINIDEIELTNFLNRLCKENIEERRKLIKTFKIKSADFSISDLQKILVYILVSVALLLLSLSSFAAFMTIMIVMGISAFIARWRPDNLTLRRYAGTATWLGLINMVLCFGIIKVYDNITEDVAEQVAIEIEEFQRQNATFPIDIKSINEKLELNFIERYFANQIDYKTLDNDYELEANMLFGKRRKYDKNNSEWK
ncbi:STM3941 family protein [uncultured Pontibacter sp.]|uniref:STM3941 family protein n=1 Tax=uncultured Pontibacter sp. TaxID=453356 RepID=UPI00262F5B20|nr:STM3941 family protein [uncultured Pontibacter sp.]